ncbi:MAG: universal stress protein, partial [Thermomicrobiales bacterium]
MFSGIAVPLDGSPIAESALPYALALGDATRVPVTLVHAVSLSQLPLAYQVRYDAAEEAILLARAGDTLEARAQTRRARAR